jgi:hypothetical protein
MDSNGAPRSSARDTYMAIVLCTVVGIPCLLFFEVLTGGLLSYLLLSVVILAVLGFINYLLWGRSLNRQVAGEREEEEFRTRMEAEQWPYDDPPPPRRF